MPSWNLCRHTPSVYTSERVSTEAWPANCSGDMYAGVPIIWPSIVTIEWLRSVSSPTALAMPKSMTLGISSPSISVTMTLDGLRSRCMMPLTWACCTARQTFSNSLSRCSRLSRARLAASVMGSPSTNSMTKYGRPLGARPASMTRATLGWSIIASAWRSASKRVMMRRDSMPALRIFSATVRLTGSDCEARKTRPNPPSPTSRSST